MLDRKKDHADKTAVQPSESLRDQHIKSHLDAANISLRKDEIHAIALKAAQEEIRATAFAEVALNAQRQVLLVEERVNKLQNALNQANKERDAALRDLSSADIEAVRHERDRLTADLDHLRHHFAAMEAHANEMARLKTVAEADRIQLERRSASLDRLRESTVFKASKPLRWVEKQLRGKTPAQSKLAGRLAPTGPSETAPLPDSQSSNHVDILYLIGCWEGESKRYRVHNLIEGCENLGYTSSSLDSSDMREIIAQGMKPRVVVFFRSPFDHKHGVVEVLDYLQSHNITTVFDVDDYIFEPSIIGHIAGASVLPRDKAVEYEWGVRAYRSLMLCCDKATASTQFLAQQIENLGRPSSVVVNSVNKAQLDHANATLARPRLNDGNIRIGYYSGSATHSRDFAACADGLKAALREEPSLVFRLAGHLALDASWDEFADRIERQAFMTPLEMLQSQYECAVTLAPLEEGNPFCEGKSELKYFESALVETPTIASRTAPFKAAIQDGITGKLASTAEEWKSSILSLARNKTLRSDLGKAARKHALNAFSTETAARQALVAYGLEERVTPPEKHADGSAIGWIVPGLIIGGGGHRNILRAAYHLERLGHDVRLYFSDTNMSASELKRAVREHFYPFSGSVSKFEGRANGEDVLMATHWSTVSLAQSVEADVGEVMYFVQDFEPAFYPIGSEYLMAENTYRKGLYAVCSGPWCETLLKRDYGMEADHFRFPIDQSVYFPRAGKERQNRILFFAKPDMPRRCFLIGVSALRELHKLKPDLEIMFFGSEAARSHPIDFPVTFSGVLPGIDDLAELYATSRAGMVFSTTNPSLVPYEMMACGLPVIDLGRPGNEVNYGDRFDLALLADPEPAAMARQIANMLDHPKEAEARSRKGIAFAQSFPSEDEMAQRVEQLIVARYRARKKKVRETNRVKPSPKDKHRRASSTSRTAP